MKTRIYHSDQIQKALDSISAIENAKIEAKMLIAARIDDALMAKNWSKKQLLLKLQKQNQSQITKWLSGVHNFTVDTLVEIESALDIKLLNLDLTEEKEEKRELVVKIQATGGYISDSPNHLKGRASMTPRRAWVKTKNFQGGNITHIQSAKWQTEA